jgi:endonuclease/exonuclease/phosphatase (EEP) superfamily protein YafD
MAGPRVSIATLNIEYFTMGVEPGIRAIKSLDADIVLLGENTLGPADVAAHGSLLDPYEMVVGHKNSTAILARRPILWWKEVELPTREASLSGSNDPSTMDRHPHRSFLHAVVDIDSIPVHVISVRFIAGRPKDHSFKEGIRWGRYLLRAQQEETAFLLSYLHALDGPVIFGGDLNATPGSKTLRPIHACATDAWLEHHLWGAPTFRTGLPTQRLDYLFCMNGVVPVDSDLPAVTVSDHLPVRAHVAIPHHPPAGAVSSTVAYQFPR